MPLLLAVTTWVLPVPTVSVTDALASALPVIAVVCSLPPIRSSEATTFREGAEGAWVSIVTVAEPEAALVLPA